MQARSPLTFHEINFSVTAAYPFGTVIKSQGYDDVSKLRHALECPRRENAGDTAPAHGLTLWRIEYPEFDTEDLLLRNFLLCPMRSMVPTMMRTML